MNRISKEQFVGGWLISNLGALALLVMVFLFGALFPRGSVLHLIIFSFIAYALLIYALVLYFILIYKMWLAIDGLGARTSPGKAVGFMFIPLFNLYWMFQVFWGWTVDFNKIAKERNFNSPHMPEGLALTATIFGVIGFIPYLGLLLWPVQIILLTILFTKICNGINSMPEIPSEQRVTGNDMPLENAKISGSAIASLVCGVIGFFTAGLAGIAGLILGIVGLNKIRKSAGQLKGEGLAIAGIAVSSTAIIVIPILVAILLPALSNARQMARSTVAMSNARQLGLAFTLYANEYNDSLPVSESWPNMISRYVGDSNVISRSPYDHEAGRFFAMNASLKGSKLNRVRQPAQTVLLFECRSGSPATGGPELLPQFPRGPKGFIVGFVDGHVECVKPNGMSQLIWSPNLNK